MLRGKIALKSLDVINGERQNIYGAPEDSFGKIAQYWNAYLEDKKGPLDRHDVAVLMLLMKVARITTGSGGLDSYVDSIGYAALACDLAGLEKETGKIDYDTVLKKVEGLLHA